MNLLLDAVSSLGPELILPDVMPLEELVELLGLPSHVIELAYLGAADLLSAKRRNEEGVRPVGSSLPNRSVRGFHSGGQSLGGSNRKRRSSPPPSRNSSMAEKVWAEGTRTRKSMPSSASAWKTSCDG